MDPTVMAMVVVGMTSVVGGLARLAYKVVKERAEVRRAEVTQRGLSERVRPLPPGSRLSERSAPCPQSSSPPRPASPRGVLNTLQPSF